MRRLGMLADMVVFGVVLSSYQLGCPPPLLRPLLRSVTTFGLLTVRYEGAGIGAGIRHYDVGGAMIDDYLLQLINESTGTLDCKQTQIVCVDVGVGVCCVVFARQCRTRVHWRSRWGWCVVRRWCLRVIACDRMCD